MREIKYLLLCSLCYNCVNAPPHDQSYPIPNYVRVFHDIQQMPNPPDANARCIYTTDMIRRWVYAATARLLFMRNMFEGLSCSIR